ncbi:helix-turn-helix transcriptional regulator [Dactylosporangium sp. CA-233914]|uniref:helix-turn-helix transcriptional regulator n=1 Tax=Dactylosporangium sp. CA-233914 TaxID=3239934 RepID=UPI003D900266
MTRESTSVATPEPTAPVPTVRVHGADPILAAAERHIIRHHGEHLSLAIVAAAVPVSPYHLAHLFQRERATTFLKYLTRIRLKRAEALLRESELPVAVIAERVGFRSPKRFGALFKRAMGVSPTAFRAATCRQS